MMYLLPFGSSVALKATTGILWRWIGSRVPPSVTSRSTLKSGDGERGRGALIIVGEVVGDVVGEEVEDMFLCVEWDCRLVR
jgi:hypothetical protein